MIDWFYKATPTKVSFDDTRDLAVDSGFLCRSAFEKNGSRADNTQHVHLGDLLHVYFTGDGDPKIIGTFQVIGPNEHAVPSLFGQGVTGGSRVRVSSRSPTRASSRGYG